MRALVAGATGYLGGFVARELKARRHLVRALARSPRGLAPLKDELDDIVLAEVTRADSLESVCEGIDVVFSSIGITRHRDGLTFRDVDYQGNRNLLDAALRAGVRRFVYVSVYDGPRLRHLDIVAAHEDFVDALAASGMDHAVLRPTGYFSDMGGIFEMAGRGRVWLVGSGHTRANPIHGADLAVSCVDAMEQEPGRAIDVGGPEILTWRQIAEIAFRVQGRPVRCTRIPAWVMRLASALIRPFSRHQSGLLAFFTTMATRDMVAPATGTRTIEAHFRALSTGS